MVDLCTGPYRAGSSGEGRTPALPLVSCLKVTVTVSQQDSMKNFFSSFSGKDGILLHQRKIPLLLIPAWAAHIHEDQRLSAGQKKIPRPAGRDDAGTACRLPSVHIRYARYAILIRSRPPAIWEGKRLQHLSLISNFGKGKARG